MSMPVKDFIERLKIAANTKNMYVLGCYGTQLTPANKAYKKQQYPWNAQGARGVKLDNIDTDAFGFDCICMIKGVLWGFLGTVNHAKGCGGAIYKSNGVPDIGCDQAFELCTNQSTDFSNIEPGEFVWQKGHIGVYVGDGLAIECTYSHKDGVQYSACNCEKEGYFSRYWTKHGKSPWIDYTNGVQPAPAPKHDWTALKKELNPKIQVQKGVKDSGNSHQVRELQKALITLGYSCGVSGADGSFGAATQKAVMAFQKDNNLEVDGYAGINTFLAILAK